MDVEELHKKYTHQSEFIYWLLANLFEFEAQCGLTDFIHWSESWLKKFLANQ